MSQQFTPGPYRRIGRFVYALNEGGTNRFHAQVSPGWLCGSRRDDDRTRDDECEAVAALFRASPDMYQRLENCAEFLRAMGHTVEARICDRVLAQARGESTEHTA